MRLTFPRLGFLILAGAAFALTGRLAWIGWNSKVMEREIREKWATSQPATMPQTLPTERERALNYADYLSQQSRQSYIFSALFLGLWTVAAIKTWRRRWPGDRD